MESDAPPSAGLYDVLGWFEKNKHRVAYGVAGLLIVGAVIGFVVWHSGQREIDGEEALSAVHMPFSPTETPAPGTAEALAKVAQEYAGTPAAAKALLRAGTVYFDAGNYAKAQEQFDAYIRQHGDTPWVSHAVYGIAVCLDAQNKPTEAITKYNDFLRSYPSDVSADQVRLNLARLYDQTGQAALALETLNKLTAAAQGAAAPGAYNPMAAEAEDRKKQLLAKHPELIPPAPAMAAPSIVMQTNVVRATNLAGLTNLIRNANPSLSPTGGAPRILLNQPQPTPGK